MEHRSGAVVVSVESGLATVRLSRKHGNAINGELVDGLHAAFRQTASDPAVRGVMLSAAGRIFCPGLDLQELISFDRPRMHDFMSRFCSAMLAAYRFPKPVVAAVSGHALAGGCLLALTADRRVLRRGAQVGFNLVRVGVPLPYGLALILRDSVPALRLEEVALVGRNYADEEAIAAGIAHELHGEGGFEEHCLSRLEEMASKDLQAFAITKRYLRSTTVERFEADNERLLPEFLDCWFAEQTRARMEEMVAELQGRSRG